MGLFDPQKISSSGVECNRVLHGTWHMDRAELSFHLNAGNLLTTRLAMRLNACLSRSLLPVTSPACSCLLPHSQSRSLQGLNRGEELLEGGWKWPRSRQLHLLSLVQLDVWSVSSHCPGLLVLELELQVHHGYCPA